MDDSRRGFLRMFSIGVAVPTTVAAAIVASTQEDLSPVARQAAKAALKNNKNKSPYLMYLTGADMTSTTLSLHDTCDDKEDIVSLGIGKDGKMWLKQHGKWERIQTG